MNRLHLSHVTTFFSGILFALGLGISGMTQPAKIIGFLDFGGAWDPSLLFVMIGAVGLHGLAHRLSLRQPAPIFAQAFQRSTLQSITPRLIVGAGLFGVGWGLAGYCPGPALVSLIVGSSLPFVIAMLGGMGIYELMERVFLKK